ncbi:transposase [Streptomyces sp. NPDC005931]
MGRNQWAYLPHDLPQKSATYYYFAAWREPPVSGPHLPAGMPSFG